MQLGVDQAGPFGHTQQPIRITLASSSNIETLPIVTYRQFDRAVDIAQRHVDARGIRVTGHIGQGLLHDAEDGRRRGVR